MRIFLTGISGYLGSVLAIRLAEQAEVESITGIDVAPPRFPLPEKAAFLQMDVRSSELAGRMAGYDVVIHTAFIVLWKSKMPAHVRDDINLNGTVNVARAALQNNVKRFLHTSSTAAYDPRHMFDGPIITEETPLDPGDSPFYYRKSKALSEKMLVENFASSPIQLIVFRPTYVVGPANRETVPSYRQSLVKVPGRNPAVQYVHEDDVANAFIQALRIPMPGAYNVAPDDSLSLLDAAHILGMEHLMTVPLWLARWITALRWRYFGSLVHHSWVDVTYPKSMIPIRNVKLKATGWRPIYSSEEAFRSMLTE
jgi:nucleoside-diphosphate-sugar epimerase